MTDGWVVLVPLGLLALGIALEAVLAGVLSPRGKGWLAFASGLASLGGVVSTWPAILAGRTFDVTFGRWDGPIQLAYHVDGLGFLFALMAAGIGTAVLLYSVDYMAGEKGATRFYALVLLFIGGLIHLVYVADLFLLYLGWEIVGLCSFLLVGFWYTQPEAARGARKVLTMTHLAGYGLLAAVVVLYARTGSTQWTDPALQRAFSTGIFVLVVVAALAKSVQFPLHTWIPDAMAAPTPVSALLHAACYVKAGVYLVARLHSLGAWPAEWGLALSWVGTVTLLVGALFMLAQRDLKRLLAFSTVSQIGYMMLGLGLGTPLGIAAGLLHCLNHGLFKGGLFLCAGSVQHACGTRDMERLGGLARRMPQTLRIWIICAAGIAGVPLLNGFVSKWMLYTAALEAGQPLLALVPWVASVLTVFAFLKATSGVFLGSDGDATAHAHEAPWSMRAGGWVLASGCVLLGIAPQAAIGTLVNPLLPALGCAPLAGVTWFGLFAGQGAWLATGGLVIALVALAFGALVYSVPLRGGVVATGGAATVFTGGEPLGAQGHLGASDFSAIVKSELRPFYEAFDADRMWLALWRGAERASLLAASRLEPFDRVPAAVLGVVAVLLGALVWLVPPPVVGTAGIPPGWAEAVPWPLAAGTALALAGLLVAGISVRRLHRLLGILTLAGALACAAVLVEAVVIRTLLLESAAFVALVALWRSSDRPTTRWGYLAAVVLSSAGMVGGAVLAEQGHGQAALALLVPGIAVKLGLVPAWIWLPLVAESTPAIVAGLVIAVVDVAAFGEVLGLGAAHPWVFGAQAIWLTLGGASAVVGALLAMAQRDLKRLLAFSTLADMGLMTLALATGGAFGASGAALGAGAHALAKALLFVSLSGPEADGERLVDARGLAARHPAAAAGFLIGSLSVLGVPPTFGYVAHWRIFASVAGNGPLLAVCCAAAMLSVAVYARAIASFWWGGESADATGVADARAAGYSRPLLATAVVALSLAVLAAGFWPSLLGGRL